MTGTILITGGSGQVGRALRALAWPAGVVLDCPDRHELDLDRPETIAAVLGGRRFAAIIHAGAYTQVDRAETEPARAFTVNGAATAALTAISAAADIPIVYVSTDFVFDGTAGGYRAETERPAPLSVYGGSKLAGEIAVATVNPRHVIVRTAWLVGPHGCNFVRSMLALPPDATARVVTDQRGCPTGAGDLAEALRHIALAMIADRDAPRGPFHFVNAGEASWYEFAVEIFRLARGHGLAVPEVLPIATAGYPTAARRPADSRLSTVRLTASHGIVPRPWQEMLAETVALLAIPALGGGPA